MLNLEFGTPRVVSMLSGVEPLAEHPFDMGLVSRRPLSGAET